MQFFISFLSGVALFYSFQYFPFSTSLALLLSSVYLSVKRRFFLILIILSGIAFAFMRYEPVKDMSHIRGKEATVRGIFESYPIETDSGMFKQVLDMKSAVDIRTGEKLNELTGRETILLSDRGFDPGTECEIAIKFFRDEKRFNPSTSSGSRQGSDELHSKLLEVIVSGDKRMSLNSKIQEYRYRLNKYISENFKRDSGAFIASLTTGQTANIDEKLRDAFNATGLAHILSISGTHFGLFSVFLFGIFRFLIRAFPYRVLQRITIFLTPSQAAAVLCLPFMLAYLGLSGGSIPAVRSFIMIGLFLTGLVIGRKGFWLNSLLFAAFVLTIWDPNVIFSLSFQLSFLAVLFIGFSICDRKENTEDRTQNTEDSKVFRYFKNAVFLTFSASIGTAPLVAYHFHYFSIISPISNLFIAPFIGFILIPLSIVSSFLFLITGHYIFTPAVSAISDVSIFLVRLLSEIPYADLKVPAFQPIVVLLFYAGFIFYFLSKRPENADRNEKPNNFDEMPKQACPEEMLNQVQHDTFRVRHDSIVSKGLKIVILNHALNLFHGSFQNLYRHLWRRKRYTLIIPFIPIMIYLFLSVFEKNELNITFLDVGQGDSSVIELPDGKTIVIDTGRSGRETISFLKYRGKNSVDAIILSHIHPDHTGGLDYISKRVKVKELWDNGRLILPDTCLSDPSTKLRTGINHRVLSRGDIIEGRGYRIYVFHPYPEFYTMYGNEYLEANNDSLVLKIEGKNKSFLFSGDVEEEAEEDIVHLGRWLKSDVVKVPHHGGKTSSYKPFFEAVSPDVAVISVGHNNSFGHPHREIINILHGVKILRTDIDGAIKIRESEKGLEIKTYKNSQFERGRSFNNEMKNIKRLFETW